MLFRALVFLDGTESRDLDDLAPEMHVCQAEASPDETAVAEHLAHLLRARVRGDVEVLGLTPKQQVAHPATDQVGLITG